MFTSMSGEGHLSGGQSSSSPAGRGLASPGLDSQESSWIGLLSRPALSFLQRYLPGRPRAPARADTGAGWVKTSFVDEESEFLRQLDGMMPLQHAAPHLTVLRCQHDGAAGLLEPSGGSTLPWLTADSLREMGIQSAEEMDLNLCQQTQIGYLSSVRTFFSHVLLSSVSSQEIKPTGGKDWEPLGRSVKSRTWWGSLWGGEESSHRGLMSDLSWAEDGTGTGRPCPQQPVTETKAPETTDVFVQSGGGGWTLGENTGPTDHKEEPANNGGLQTVQNTEGSTTERRLSISTHLSRSGVAAACSEVALLTPDQDNGYSSLEEEHFQVCHLNMVKALNEEQEAESTESTAAAAATAAVTIKTEMEEETSEEGASASGQVDKEERTQEEEEEQDAAPQEDQAAALTTPQCQNKAIAFIMGCPCSDDDDDSSQSDEESSDDEDDDDDGFDSEGSSDLSDSTDEDDEDDDEASDSEADSEAERLWNSLCQTVDPYNPRNFTARLRTASTPPRTIPTPTPPSSTQSTPASSPDPPSSLGASPLLTSSSPPSGQDIWDDSTSASEVDEAESLRLWSSFSCSPDPYSPFNFQAPLRTRGPAEAGPRARTRAKKASQTPPRSPRHNPAFPPEYRKEEAEERLDSGFSEPSTSSTQSCSTTKKVRFCDDVEEFFASCGEEEEDRRGPWEELARDRCRFLRRCQEVETSIAYCLQPQHRSLVYRRLTSLLYVQDA
ncbi:protein phosphatase 1 regulatory subunit 15B [Epinephelus moara]|uniref:protein phosphatase 1 regulatory subunit 15B n=1 Tax=Epinephelus moara TaxID=300413 RepID=UPI00214DF2BA|nr:protein phosphatase 1 regulatory subunit 15B [Epinephelus moara]